MKIVPQTSVGAEIAGQDLRIAVIRAFGGKRRLLHMEVLAGFAALTEEDRVTHLAAHFKKHKLTGFNVHLTIPGPWGVTRDLELPVSVGTGDALRSAAALQVENLSPWALDEIYWDCVWEPPAKGTRSIVLHIGIVPRTLLDPWIALFRSARLALTGVSLSSLSWAHGATVLWGKERPAMIMAAEDNYVESTLIQGDRLYAVHMPGADSAQLVTASALRLMRAGRVESIDQVQFVGYGASAAQGGLEAAPLPIEFAGGTLYEHPPATAFGPIASALLGLERSSFRLNLIPPQLRFQRNYLQLVPTYGLVAALILLGVFSQIREPYQQSLYAQRLDGEARRLAGEVRSVADQEARLNRVSDRLKTLDGLMRARDANLEALRELSRMLPEGTWLSSYSSQDNVVTVAGFSNSAAAIQKQLEDSPVFRDVQFTSSITRDASGRDRFTLRASLEVRP
jgi:general secretion pathway protein L